MNAPKHARPATKADETPEFKELWEKIWPGVKSQYDARALARDAFFRHVWWRDAEQRDIVDAARSYVRTAKPGDCRLLLSNWLDRGFYEDLAEAERAYQQRILDRQQQPSNVVTMNVVLPKNHFQNRA
jgi:hypothetical protein